MVSQFQDCYLSFTGTHWNVDVALGSSRTRWEKERERERLERAGVLYSNYRLFAEVTYLSDTAHRSAIKLDFSISHDRNSVLILCII